MSSRSTSLAALACVIAFHGSALAQTTVNGPYYATPSWDQTFPTASRFLVLSNFGGQAVLDRETGLVWQRAFDAVAVPWLTAYDRCLRQQTGGRNGWRLPSAAEVLTLFDAVPMNVDPLPAGHPFTGFPATGTQLWTATSVDAAVHYQVQYFPGLVGLQPVRYGDAAGGYVFCVRGPTG